MSTWVLRRNASRVVVLNDRQEVFLIQARDPADHTKESWWEIPGGGIDPGESSADAARRELIEEAGIDDAEVGPVVWTQHVEFDFGGYHFDQDEVIHVAWTTQHETRAGQGLEALEALAFQSARWWPWQEVVASDQNFLPAELPSLIGQLVEGPLPDPPLDLDTLRSSS